MGGGGGGGWTLLIIRIIMIAHLYSAHIHYLPEAL